MAEGYDWQHGGWGSAPKFPLPVRLLFLLQQAAAGDTDSLKMAEHALTAMAKGGMVDVVGGGFARYSTDARWLVPHFEKMLYDNALLARPQDLQDNATPSGSSLAVQALLRMASFSGNAQWNQLALETIERGASMATVYPTVFSNWLIAYAMALSEGVEIAILGDPQDARTQQLTDVVWDTYRPFQISAIANDPPPANAPPLLHDRRSIDQNPTAYVCRNHTCQMPATTVEALIKQLNRS